MNDLKLWHNDALGESAAAALTKNNFDAKYFKTKEAAIAEILNIIPPDATIGIGGSWTIATELSLNDTLEKRGHTVYEHGKPGLSPEESMATRRKELLADVFLAGTNAITLDGKLVNVDGAGNRVAAMIFGPKKVILVAGVNKIVKNVEEAERRIELYAAPLNNKRLNISNPCTKTGYCVDCNSPARICNITTIIKKRPVTLDFHVIIIGEELGF